MTGRPTDDHDPKGLIREAYLIEGITEAECRSIFMDWALSIPGGDMAARLPELLARHGEAHPDHPMTRVLKEGLAHPPRPERRGGRSGRKRAP